jgi:hypothetical protein
MKKNNVPLSGRSHRTTADKESPSHVAIKLVAMSGGNRM